MRKVDTSPFGLILHALRSQADLTLGQLAERSGLSREAVGHLERRVSSPTYATAAALADALGVGMDAFRPGLLARPLESSSLKQARLAALGVWARERAAKRLHSDPMPLMFPGESERLVEEGRQVDDLHTPAAQVEGPVEPAAQVEGPVEPAAQVEGPVEPAQPGDLTAQILRGKAELHPLDPGDRKAFHQARRRADKAGKHSLECVAAGYEAVRRHRAIARSAENQPPRTRQDRRSHPRPAQGTTEKAAQGCGRKKGGQDASTSLQ